VQQMAIQTGRPVTMASRGIVAAPHYLAAEAGTWALQQGGNAVDAAIASSAVLCVVEPHMAGLGGDATLMVWQPGRGQPLCLNGSGAAGGRASVEYYRDRGHDAVPARGVLAASTAPGAVAAWGDVHGRWGALAWEELFEPALHYAESGFPVSAQLARRLAQAQPLLERSEGTAAIFLREGAPYAEGETLVQRDLARSLESLAADGASTLYTGDLAAAIADDLERRGGLLSRSDLAGHHSAWVAPLRTAYRGRTLYELPPNTLGPAAMLTANLLEGWDVAAMGDQGAVYYHTMAEVAKISLADGGAWPADPAFVAASLERLLSKEHAERRRTQVQASRARPLADYAEWAQQAVCPLPPLTGTAAVVAVDAGGLAVSLVQSLHADFGSGVVAGDSGILLHSSGAGFDLDPASPNRLEPHKRPVQALLPAMLFAGERPWLVFGASGGVAQPQIHAGLLTRLADLGQNVQQAIEAPRWRYEAAGDGGMGTLNIEGRVADSVLRQLREMGHEVRAVDDWAEMMGQAQGVVVDRERGILAGGADPRGDGQAIGW